MALSLPGVRGDSLETLLASKRFYTPPSYHPTVCKSIAAIVRIAAAQTSLVATMHPQWRSQDEQVTWATAWPHSGKYTRRKKIFKLYQTDK